MQRQECPVGYWFAPQAQCLQISHYFSFSFMELQVLSVVSSELLTLCCILHDFRSSGENGHNE